MKKIPTVFERDWEGDRRYVTSEVVPGCEWVFKGEGEPTRKYDGTCVMFDGEHWWARREVKAGKPEPAGFVGLETDAETGKMVGREPIEQSGFARWHADAVEHGDLQSHYAEGTYELCGPKINGNPESAPVHTLVRHQTAASLSDAPRDFDGLATWLHAHSYEGIVWHHPDGRMAKIKKRDFRAPGNAASLPNRPTED